MFTARLRLEAGLKRVRHGRGNVESEEGTYVVVELVPRYSDEVASVRDVEQPIVIILVTSDAHGGEL